jgi:GT2 family glycosyltransferase
MLVRRAIFQQVGEFDTQMLNTKEHLDFCLLVTQVGGKIYFEPSSIATYVLGPPLQLSDLHFFMLRWSDAWTLQSLNRFRKKWDLDEDGYFQNKYKKLGWRRKGTIIKPLIRRLTFGQENKPLKKIFSRLERRLNHLLTQRYYQQVLTKD